MIFLNVISFKLTISNKDIPHKSIIYLSIIY